MKIEFRIPNLSSKFYFQGLTPISPSQCLIEGGLNLKDGGIVDDKGCITNCDNLHTYLTNSQNAGYSSGSTPPDDLEAGDVVIFGKSNDTYAHATIVVGGSGQSIRLAAHCNDRWDEPLSWFLSQFTLVAYYRLPQNFLVSVQPTWQNFTKPNESHTHYITIKNNTNESKTANITMKLIKASKSISITKYPATSLNLPAKGEARTSFVVT